MNRSIERIILSVLALLIVAAITVVIILLDRMIGVSA